MEEWGILEGGIGRIWGPIIRSNCRITSRSWRSLSTRIKTEAVRKNSPQKNNNHTSQSSKPRTPIPTPIPTIPSTCKKSPCC